jgi:ribosomal protein S18 acetylase RimI-like enzyme
VSSEHQKRGLGRQLVDACLQALKAEGIEKVHLWVRVNNESGKSFWNHVGWRERDDIALMSIVTGDNPNA